MSSLPTKHRTDDEWAAYVKASQHIMLEQMRNVGLEMPEYIKKMGGMDGMGGDGKLRKKPESEEAKPEDKAQQEKLKAEKAQLDVFVEKTLDKMMENPEFMEEGLLQMNKALETYTDNFAAANKELLDQL
ncbi:hypothetical protein ONZ45_g4771 [Pleurotus djamor]|nr:hypothetical protein ONZ45_g4771 [Pleurotus djamor]